MDFVTEARAAGVDLTLVGIPFANHGYDSVAADSIGNQARLSITLSYLEARGL